MPTQAAVVAEAVDDVREKLKQRVQETIDEVRAIRDEMRRRNDEEEKRRLRRLSRDGLKAVKP